MKKLNITLLMSMLLAGCQLKTRPLPGPVDYPRSVPAGAQTIGNDVESPPGRMRVQAIDSPSTPPAAAAAAEVPAETRAGAAGDELVSIAIEQTPLPMFVQILYGNVLKRPYTLDPSITSRTDPVTFKTSQPLPKSRVFQLADTLLRNYGLVAQDLDGLVRIAPLGSLVSSSIPMIRRDGSDAGGGGEQRQVFHHVELSVVRVADMSQWLKQMLGTRITLYEDPNQNAFLLAGTAGDVRAAIDLIQSLDQPRMRGRVARRLTPANASAQDLAVRLTEVLTAQGYGAALTVTSTASVLVLPIPSIGSVVVFAANEQTMGHVLRWARELDQAPQSSRTNNALFTYPVRFADAQMLARTLGELLGGTPAAAAPTPAGPIGGGAAQSAAAPRLTGGRVVVNNATNTLIFRGTTAEEQQQIRQLMLELDRPTKSAMIEVVVAELAVGALQRLGVQWSYNGLNGVTAARSATLGGSGFSFSYTNAARDILAAIDALATDSQARVLSNPKVMARNGETATIQVGSEVPIVTTQQTTGAVGGNPFPGGGANGVLQQIQYRSTGVILTVRPVINSGNRLDLDVMQEVSSATATETGVTSTPTISTRRIETKLSLRDGSTVLLGGLISRDTSTSKGGVPLLKDIPLLGAAFRNRSESVQERELLVMITPYVVNDDFEAEEISAAIQKTFGGWAQEIKASRVVLQAEPRESQVPGKPASELGDPLNETVDIAPGTSMPAVPSTPSGSAAKPLGAPVVRGEDGVKMSMPDRPVVGPVPLGPDGKTTDAKPAASKPTEGRPADSKTPVPPKGTAPMRPVTDPKLLEEFEKQVKGKR
jgi:general secretion pathway protein D